ncbi:MAG: hypothetical protein GY870_20050 [archaeon]|nr:hypothetical protein [archaeon]
MLKILGEKTFTYENYSTTCCIISLDRSYLVLVTDQSNYGIGNIMMSAPPFIEGTRAMSTPSPLFGLKQNLLTKMVSEFCAVKLKNPCIVMVHVLGMQRKEQFVSNCVMKSLKQTIEEVIKT